MKYVLGTASAAATTMDGQNAANNVLVGGRSFVFPMCTCNPVING